MVCSRNLRFCHKFFTLNRLKISDLWQIGGFRNEGSSNEAEIKRGINAIPG